MPETIKLGVSACVIGEPVQWDGTHCRDTYLSDILSKYVVFVPLCPEIACGLGIPREKLRQIDCGGKIRLIGRDSGDDLTEKMTRWTDKIQPGLIKEKLDGFVLKDYSPSCGLTHVKIYSTKGGPPRYGMGFCTAILMEHAPHLPIETVERLHNPVLRENFVRRVFVHHRWQQLLTKGYDIGHLVDFHTRHKMLIRAHDLATYRELGRLLGECTMCNIKEIFDSYANRLFAGLSRRATPKKTSDVLSHAAGDFKKHLNHFDRQELMDKITAYRKGQIPLLIPVTIINHFAHKYDKPYLLQQYFLNPEPAELKLLNHV